MAVWVFEPSGALSSFEVTDPAATRRALGGRPEVVRRSSQWSSSRFTGGEKPTGAHAAGIPPEVWGLGLWLEFGRTRRANKEKTTCGGERDTWMSTCRLLGT